MDMELLKLYFKKYDEWEQADDTRKTELLPDLEALSNCVINMLEIGG